MNKKSYIKKKTDIVLLLGKSEYIKHTMTKKTANLYYNNEQEMKKCVTLLNHGDHH